MTQRNRSWLIVVVGIMTGLWVALTVQRCQHINQTRDAAIRIRMMGGK